MKSRIEEVKTSLEIDEDIKLHRTGWIIQRIGWGLMLTFLVLASLGLFGNGVLSNRTVSEGAVSLDHDRFLRRNADTNMKLRVRSVNDGVRVTLTAAFIEVYQIEGITPEPKNQAIHNGETLLDFPGTGQANIVFDLTVREDHLGSTSSAIRVNDAEITIHNYIYP